MPEDNPRAIAQGPPTWRQTRVRPSRLMFLKGLGGLLTPSPLLLVRDCHAAQDAPGYGLTRQSRARCKGINKYF